MLGILIVAEQLPKNPISFIVCFYAYLKASEESIMQ